MNDTKPTYLSKTLWLNLILAIAAFFPNISSVVQSHPELTIAGFAIANMIMRVVSKSELTLY